LRDETRHLRTGLVGLVSSSTPSCPIKIKALYGLRIADDHGRGAPDGLECGGNLTSVVPSESVVGDLGVGLTRGDWPADALN